MVCAFAGIMTVEVLVLDALIPVGRLVPPDRDGCVTLQITVTKFGEM